MAVTASEFIQRYLQDAIALEQTVEVRMRSMAKDCNEGAAKELFLRHADESREQTTQLTTRLRQTGGSPSATKGVVAHLLGNLRRRAPVASSTTDRETQDLLLAYALQHTSIAVYEALHAAADYLGDLETSALAQRIQAEEQKAAESFWKLLGGAAVSAIQHERAAGAEWAAHT
jgi:ferritin-like metal-binding protein YciE